MRDTFVFCCFTGLAFIDVQTLRRTDISTDSDGRMWIRKTREKTDELSIIPLLDVPKSIMDKYENHPTVLSKGVVLPVMSNQKVNAYLKELADLAKIQKHLTSHIACHTRTHRLRPLGVGRFPVNADPVDMPLHSDLPLVACG